MNPTIAYTIISLSATGIAAAIILYIIAQRFRVIEDPRIDDVEDALPSANCGGCGYAGCRNFAEACVKADSLSGLFCPPGGNETMGEVASILGMEATEQDPQVAVIRCSGSYACRPRTNNYDGAASCAVASSLYAGDTGCQFGCLSHGDCVRVCDFDAIHMNPETGLPEVTDENCTACNACVVACPKDIIELRKRNKRDRKIFVSCINEDKGGIAKKSCSVACTGCGKCEKVCPHDAITIENFLAYIDPVKCKLCRKCAPECPTDAILEIGFPPRKPKPEEVVKVEAGEKPGTESGTEKPVEKPAEKTETAESKADKDKPMNQEESN
jgi:electron transport complex protein RnfB